MSRMTRRRERAALARTIVRSARASLPWRPITLPRSSGAMYNVGEKVTPEQALPADLLFYGPDGTQSVTMFLGNNQMLEVTDAGVVVSPVRTTDMAPYLIRIIA